MRDLTIRRATIDDLEAVVPLFDAYRQFYRQPPDLGRAREFLRERLSQRDTMVFVAALEHEAELAGFTQLFPTFTSVSTGRAWILNDLYVAPQFRRQKVARALLERAGEHARQTGALYLELATEVSNGPAQRLYQSLGWTLQSGFYHYQLRIR